MGLTTIDLHIRGPFATSRPFDPVGAATFDPDENTQPPPPIPTSLIRVPPAYMALQSVPWSVARVHLREALGEPFVCDVFLTRPENFRPDPKAAESSETVFDRLSKLIDDDDDSNTTPNGSQDDLKSITDLFDAQKQSASGGPAPDYTNLWNVPNAASQASDAINTWWQTESAKDPLSNWEQEILGMPADELWQEDPAPNPGLFMDKLLSVLVRRTAADGTQLGRWITGLCTEFEDMGPITDHRRLIRIRLEPQLARLSLRRDHRMFDGGQSALDVLTSLFKDAEIYPGFTATYFPPARARIVQYGETDLELALRLLSEEGLVPLFECHLGAERMVLVRPEEYQLVGLSQPLLAMDANDMPLPRLDFGVGPQNREGLYGFSVKRALAPTGALLRSTNFSISYNAATEVPTHVNEGRYDVAEPLEEKVLTDEVPLVLEQYPARTALAFDADAAQQSDVVVLSDEALYETRVARNGSLVGTGRSNAVALTVGQIVPVVDATGSLPIYEPDVQPFGRSFQVTRLESLAEDATALGNGGSIGVDLPPRPDALARTTQPFEAALSMVPFDAAYHLGYFPPRRRRPGIDGVQTSIVRAGVFPYEEGHSRLGADSVGRVRGTLHWDRRERTTNGEQPLSPPIRIGGPWAGHAWGTTFMPREGMEILIAYMHGDPLQPISLGGLHGMANPAPRERPHIRFVEDVNHLGKLTEDELEALEEREKEEAEEEDETSESEAESEEKEEVELNESITVDHRLHYKPELPIKNTEDRFLNMIRTQMHPAPRERPRAYHEISFDDTPEKERLRIHSDGLFEETVKHDHRVLVGRDQTNVVQGEQIETIAGDQTLIVEGSRKKIVTGHESETVEKLQEIVVTGNRQLEVHKNQIREVGSAEQASKESLTIGDPGAGIERTLRSHRDRKTEIGGDDTRTVGGDVKGRIKGVYELTGAPLNIQAQSGAGLESTPEGDMSINGKGGIAEIVAEGGVTLVAREMSFDAAKTVRFEVADDLFLELGDNQIWWKAPGGFHVTLHGTAMVDANGDPTPNVNAHIAMDAKRQKEISFALESVKPDDDGEENGSKKFKAVMRAGKRTVKYLDANKGDPGIAIDPVDVMVIKAMFGAFKCRHVEVQKGTDEKKTFRRKTDREKKLLEEIAKLIKERGEMIKRRKEALKERAEAEDQYREAGEYRRWHEEQLEGEGGSKEDVRDAMDDLADARDELYLAERRVRQLEEAIKRAEKRKEKTADLKEELEEAKDDRDEAERDYEEAEADFKEEVEGNEDTEKSYIQACEDEREAKETWRARTEEAEQLTKDIEELDEKIAEKKAEADELELDMEEIEGWEEEAVAS